MIHMKPVISSNIATVGYDPDKKRLCVQFQTGKVYEYTDVDSDTYVKLTTAESTGKAFNELIKGGGFKFKEIELEEI